MSSTMYSDLSKRFAKMSICDADLIDAFADVHDLVGNPESAVNFLKSNVLTRDNTVAYQTTLLGLALSVSSLPRTTSGSQAAEFFHNPTRQDLSDHSFTENLIAMKLEYIATEMHKLFHSLLKMPQTRNMFLTWLGRCIYTFNDRKKLWSNQLLMSRGTLSVNDGFLMNLLNVMLRLSEPFSGPYIDTISNNILGSFAFNKKLLKVDPRYCSWSKVTPSNDFQSSNIAHFLGLSEDTMLIDTRLDEANSPQSEVSNEERPNVNFITECFFATHQVFTYGFRSIYERFYKLAQNINELQQLYADSQSLASGAPTREMIQEKMNLSMSQFYNLKAVLMVPHHTTMLIHFSAATAAYLNHLVACSSFEEALTSSEFKQITLDMCKNKKLSKNCLKYIPEMLVENIIDLMLFLKNFNEPVLVRALGLMEPIMTMIIVFMGNSTLMKNPHLRARFAEILECLMPHQSLHMPRSIIGSEVLFDDHPLKEELVTSLVNVFVSIEMTGEGVQFEQKFSYRRPMYSVLEYLWSKPIHQKALVELANDAEANIESAKQPLFLRFINLLMNDAIFLLDEALSYMNQLKETEQRKRSSEWTAMGPQQRARAEATYSHIGRLARFHNVLSASTIGTIAWLTSEIKTIFCHPTLVDRIANMLNYFLEHLVGPKKNKLKVHDSNDYEFRPKEILEKICQIYVHLGSDRNPKYKEFCTSISSDGRSYSDNLLPQATEILFRTGKSALGMEFEILSKSIHDIAERNKMDEIPTDDIPDEYLDPIMSTLMVDPVLLPSSQIIVDRSTIARHLLSDQTDPFNRSPLSMEQVIPDSELKSKIEKFLNEKAKQRHTTNDSTIESASTSSN